MTNRKYEPKPDRELSAFVAQGGVLLLEWKEAVSAAASDSAAMQAAIYQRYMEPQGDWLLYLGFCDPTIVLSPSLHFWRSFSGLFTRRLTLTPDLESIRHTVEIPVAEKELRVFIEELPPMTGAEYVSVDLLRHYWRRLNRYFTRAIAAYSGTVIGFIRQYSPTAQLLGRVFFHLVENRQADKPFAFMATYSRQINRNGHTQHVPLGNALREFKDTPQRLLELMQTVQNAALRSDLIAELLETRELFQALSWSADEAYRFLTEIPLYEASGILCRIPDWWKGAPASISLNLTVGEKAPSFVGMDALLDFNTHLMLGDAHISPEEARQLLETAEGLVLIKNKWVAVDHRRLHQTLEAYDKACRAMQRNGFSLREAMQLQLHPERLLGKQAEDVVAGVTRGQWLDTVFEKLRAPELTPVVRLNQDFKGNLRDYQQKGLNWLYFLHSLGLGACLADDMGLGKTIQLLAFLNILIADGVKHASLLIVPASLIANWTQEIERFFPSLRYLVVHPSVNPGSEARMPPNVKPHAELNDLHLVITTYNLASRYSWLQNYTWFYIILDEAQAIKNANTRRSRALGKLTSRNRILLTGTPIENHLGDLWSLFNFLNPGLLGNQSEFTRFTKKLKQQPQGYARLRAVISPYILRRLKTDRAIISDLPDKVEMKTYAQLSTKQVLLYQNVIDKIQHIIENTRGIERKGLILAALTKFKQLCNHPDQYAGSGAYKEADSGKFGRLRDICETIYEKREKVLIFTQFKEIIEPLNTFLENIFHHKGLVLHGSVPVGHRRQIIDTFQGDGYVPYMVLSLRAGGVGLNLTSASHVIHFDRWWNPAVENQATDRAFRIGQTKNVIVHKFITQGTVEEKIDLMMESKLALSNDVVTETGEAWITEMGNDALRDLFSLKL